MEFLTRVDVNLREKLNPIYASSRRRRLIRKDFTIVANDCWAGHVYRYFGLPYDSPTIGTGFFADDYIKFVFNLKKYLECDLVMMKAEESVHYREILKHGTKFHNCPYGRIGDVELRFSHYSSPTEAYDKWCRRRDRVHFDNLIFKFSEHNSCTLEHLRKFDTLPYLRKFVFTTKNYGLESQVIFKEYAGKEDIKNDTTKFRKYINLENLINGLPFKKRQE